MSRRLNSFGFGYAVFYKARFSYALQNTRSIQLAREKAPFYSLSANAYTYCPTPCTQLVIITLPPPPY
ncbi:MAG: hypothetical protein ACI9Y1_003483 [Lentisphaeria bacterium]|jgi:hypothetical protein